jgi:hypothetical protein
MEDTKTSLYPPVSAGGGDQRLIHLALAAWGFSSWILFNGTLRGESEDNRQTRALIGLVFGVLLETGHTHGLPSPLVCLLDYTHPAKPTSPFLHTHTGLWGQLPLFVRTLPEVRNRED